MSIVGLEKITVCGMASQKAAAVEGLQRLGCLHLINLRDADSDSAPSASKAAREALQYLKLCPIRRRPSVSNRHYECEETIRRALQIKQQRAVLAQERDQLRKAITDLEPWGDFKVPGSDEFAGLHLWFYRVPLTKLDAFADLQCVWSETSRDGEFAYVTAVSDSPPEEVPFRPLELDSRSLTELRSRLQAVEEEREDLHWQRVALTRWRLLLQSDLNEADDRAARIAAEAGMLAGDAVFAVHAWIPQTAIADVRAFAQANGLAIEHQQPDSDDQPPTLLKNPERVAGAEGCVTFYITPNYHAWDPTAIVFFSFSVFFGMIVADAGYGCIMAAGLLLFGRSLGSTPAQRRMRNLAWGVVSATIIYGVLVGSYFGVSPPVDSIAGRLQLRVNGEPLMSQMNIMMFVAVAIGVTHLSLANLISAWQRRHSSRCLGHVGWALSMLGAFLLAVSQIVEMDALDRTGMPLLIVGATAILCFSSDAPLLTLSPLAHLKRLLAGVMQFTNISKAFGDALSYLRLFALGLASAQLAVTFNGLAAQASDVRGVGVLLALLILVVGHGINFLLGMMGGVVHGLRLNCIEFFNWSLTEEGYPFEPFRKKAET